MNHASFLAAIREAPDDDVPRLVYADWLEDNGEADRAEFIRLQIELARGVRDQGRRLELLRRLRQLSQEHQQEWLGPLVDFAPGAVFEGAGFVEYVQTDAMRFVEYGAAVFTAHPIHRVRLRNGGGGLRRVARSPCLAWVTSLDLRDNELQDSDIQLLASSGNVGRLTQLDLSAVSLTAAGLAYIVRAERLANLREALVKNNRLGDEGAIALAYTQGLLQLERIDLSNNRISDAGAEALAVGVSRPQLSALRLADNRLSLRGIEALLQSRSLGLTVLDVTGNPIDRGAALQLQRGSRVRLVF